MTLTTSHHATIRPFDVTNRLVLSIAVPMTFAYITTPLIGIVDTAVIGQLGQVAPIGAVAVGSIMFDLILTSFNFLRAGTTGMTAQALGAADTMAVRATLYRALLIAVVAGIAILLIQEPLLNLLLYAMQPSADVTAATRTYFMIRILLLPFGLMNYALLGWFLGLGRAHLGLGLQVGISIINIALSVLFVLYWHWGIAGVAWATVAAECSMALVGLICASMTLKGKWQVPWRHLLDGGAWRRTLGVNRDIMIRSFLLIGTFAAFTAAGARHGDVILAANAVLMNFFLVGGYLLDGFATAAEQLAGRAVGARFRPAFDKALRLTFCWGGAIALVYALIILASGDTMIALIAKSTAIQATAHVFLWWVALTPLAGVLAFQFDGIFIGATWSGEMRNTMIAATATFALVLWLAGPILGNHGLWLALNLFLAMRGIGMIAMLPAKRAATFAA